MIGQSLSFGEESNNWMVSFISDSEQSLNVAVIAGAMGGVFVFMLILVVALVLVIVGLGFDSIGYQKKRMKMQ